MNSHDYENLLMAALLHDAGRLFGIEPPPPVQEVEADPALRALLNQAMDWAVPTDTHSPALVQSPLVSVFSLLTRHDSQPVRPRRFPLTPLVSTDANFNNLFPQEVVGDSYANYVNVFRGQFERLWQATANAAWQVRFNHVLALFEKYAWCLPGHSGDVCLYDHLRLTTALAACLYRLREAGKEAAPPLVLAVGDLSGIQSYIFEMATVGASAVSRRLRARSFSIALISDMASHAIARAFDLPLTNILMASGGKFYVLLPNLDAQTRLDQLRDRVEDWLFGEYNGEIGLNLAYLPLDRRDLHPSSASEPGFGAFISRLNRELNIAKQRRSRTVLQDGVGWRTDQVTIKTDFGGYGICANCGRFPGSERDDLCPQCARQAQLGGKLTRASAIAFYQGSASAKDDLEFLSDYSARVVTENDWAGIGQPYLVVRLNNPDLSTLIQYPAGLRYLANHVPTDSANNPLDFGEIANTGLMVDAKGETKGRDLLGYVKADADHLGLLFGEGLRDEHDAGSHDSAVHLAAFSREMDLFFSGWLEHALSREFGKFYTIFSGGDDVFVLGPWNQAVEFAVKVNAQFRRFTCENPAVTISGAVLYTKSRYPIARAARDARDELEKSKTRGRNRLTVLDDTFVWEEARTILEQGKMLAAFKEGALRSSFLYRLVYYGQLYRQFHDAKQAEALRFKSHFAYTLARNLRDDPTGLWEQDANQAEAARNLRDDRRGLREWGDNLLQSLFRAERSIVMEHLGLIATIVLFNRRTRRN